jgi:hypothetical protein
LAFRGLRALFVVAGIAVLYAAVHFVLSPLLRPIDASFFKTFRAPVIEEMFKYFVLWKFFELNIKSTNVVKIGLAMGLVETVINFYVVFEDMIKDLKMSFTEIDSIHLYIIIGLGLVVKFIFTGFAQITIMLAGIKISRGKISSALFISIFIHWLTNTIIFNTVA